mgnify:CR=1 FL=1
MTTFGAYTNAYLAENLKIYIDMITIIRQIPTTSAGLSLDNYAVSNNFEQLMQKIGCIYVLCIIYDINNHYHLIAPLSDNDY